MSSDTPEKLIPRRLDPRKMAQQGAVFSGTLAAEALPRLRKAVVELSDVRADLSFRRGEQGERLMEGEVAADVQLVCQRCLEPLKSHISSEFALAAVWDEEEAKQLPSSYEPWITGEGEGDVYEVLEEELLLSLPVVVYHDEFCIDATLMSSGENAAEEQQQKPNPFQVLEQLKGHIKK